MASIDSRLYWDGIGVLWRIHAQDGHNFNRTSNNNECVRLAVCLNVEIYFSLFFTVADAAFFMGINVSSPYVLC